MSRFLTSLWLAAAAVVVFAPATVAAAALKTLYNFCSKPNCTDGKKPAAGLIMDAAGNLYGTTSEGGAGGGTVFRLAPDGILTVLHAFVPRASSDGAAPEAPLVMDAAGRLYGTTRHGGATSSLADAGVVFELSPSDFKERILYEFCSEPHCADGYGPNGIIRGSGGDLYGATTDAEPDITGGVIFRLMPGGPAGKAGFDPFYAFPYPRSPSAALVADASGALYGAIGNTKPLGPTWGTVFALHPGFSTPQVLHDFCSLPRCADGFHPTDLIVMDSGVLYGTTAMGGDGPFGQGGTLFSLTPDATEAHWRFTLLHSFCEKHNCADGASPSGLVIDAAGDLYGTAGAGHAGGGLVFRLGAGGHYVVLHDFCSEANCADGSAPYGPLILDRSGNLYGVTGGGGANGEGTVFELTP
jgi:uncharacterized repeat protein (TIGR03803 family)